MADRDLVPDQYTFRTLITAFAKHEKVDGAMLMFTKMQEKGWHPDVVSYATVIDACCRIGKLDDALRLFNYYSFSELRLINHVYRHLEWIS